MTRGLELYGSPSRAGLGRLLGAGGAGLAAAAAGVTAPLRYVDHDDPVPPGPGWVAVRPVLSGISGADLALVTGRASSYLTALVGLPYVPGREVVGQVQAAVALPDGRELAAGARVVVDPAPPVAAGGADGVGAGAGGGVGIGGGGWSRVMVARRSALVAVPDGLPDERAVLVEALARAVHAVGRARIEAEDRVLVVGAGAVGLFTVLALRAYSKAGHVAVVAKHPRQAAWAVRFGADEVLDPADAVAGVRRGTHALRVSPRSGGEFLLGGVDVAFDSAGRGSSLATALRTTRAGGRVVLCGVPGAAADLTPVWARGLDLVGASRDGTDPGGAVGSGGGAGSGDGEPAPPAITRAFELAASAPLDGVVSARYPLTRWRDALEHALSAGRLGAVRVVFDPTATA